MSQTKNTLNRIMRLSLLASLGFAALLLVSAPALAAVAPNLGNAATYSILAGSQVTNTGATAISGNVGIYPGIGVPPHFTGFGTVVFGPGAAMHDADVSAQNAQFDQAAAYTALDLANGCTVTFPGAFKELAGETLVPGVYCATSFHLTSGTLTLSGNASDIWVFKSASDLIITGGAAARVLSPSCNVWWRVVSTATFDANSSLIGNILADTSITLAAGASLSGKAFARTAEVTLSSNAISGCSAAPTVTVTKVSNNNVGPFDFSGSNGISNQTITTTTSGVPVAGAKQTLTTPGVSTTITESAPPAGYTLASIVCTGLGAGGTATQDLGTRTVTLDAAATAAGSAISCIFTNNYITPPAPTAPPTLTVTKVSVGGVSTFSFTGSNGFTNQNITTLTSGVGVAGATQSLTAAGTSTTITESATPAGYVLTSIVCSGMGSGGTATPNLGTRTVTLDAAATAAGSAIACTFTNVAQGSITINKVAQGGNRTFNFTSTGTGISPSPFSITTVSGTGSQLFSGLAPGSYTVTETVPVGWNLSTLTCTDPTSNSTGNVGTLTATINLAAGESVSCTFTDVAQGSITIIKNTVGGDATFGYTASAALGTSFNITTSGGTGNHGTTTGLSAGPYTVTESTMPVGWVRAGLVCTDSTAGSTFTYSDAQANIALAAGGTVTCTFTNNLPPQPVPTPTLSEWGMIIFMVLVGLMSIYYLRRQKAKA